MVIRHKYLAALPAFAVIVVTLAAIGIYPKFFDIEWDEEVQLHDGQTTIVHMKRTFERLSGLQRWNAVQRDTEISFDAGGKIGRFSKRFQRYDVDFIHRKDGYWYIYLVNTTGSPPDKLVDWHAGFLILTPEGEIRKASSWSDLPPEFKTRNIMPATPNAAGIVKFDGTRLSRAEKLRHWKQFPGGAGDDETLKRP